MTRRPDHIPARKAIPRSALIAVMRRSGGICETDGCTRAGKEIDHVLAVALGGSNDPENLRLLCREHHAEKTAQDVARIAKADRQGARSGQQKRRAEGKVKQIKSPGFDKRYRKKMNGTVVRRDCGNTGRDEQF